MASSTKKEGTDFAALAAVLADDYQEAAIIQAGPPIEIFAQRAAPTIVLKPLQQSSGKYYFECKTHTGGYMQLGWADLSFQAVASEGKGAGDDTHSWAYDGYRCLKWHANKKEKYGQKWSAGDVIGIAVDMESSKISFSLNGNDMGEAFEGVSIQGSIYPCITLLRGERVAIYLGTEDNPFCYNPPVSFKPLTITQDIQTTETEYNKYSGHVNVIKMGISNGSFSASFPGEIMVTMMRRGLDYEKKKNALLGAGYDETLKQLQTKQDEFKTKLAKADDIGLTQNEVYAILCYTLEKPPVYRYFNSDSRKGYGGDGMDFPILTFLLREGCRKILASQPKDERTKELHRGTSIPFAANQGDIIRFGSYTSSTQSTEVARKFQESTGDSNGTQFVITSKLGAPIQFLSAFPDEEEVLIPPYETFEVVKAEGTARIFVKSVVPEELVDEYITSGSAVYSMAYLAEKLQELKVE